MKVNVIATGWILASLLGFDASCALGSTLHVTTTNDTGSGSLRQTINDAASGDTLVLSVQGLITLTNGELLISKNLTLNGPGAGSLAISGNGNSRVFHITNDVTVTLSGITITNGAAPAGIQDTNHFNGESGGGIWNSGVLTVDSCVIAGNKSGTGAAGFSVYTDLAFYAGGMGGHGGGIYNEGELLLTHSKVVDNSAGTGGVAPGGTWNSGEVSHEGWGGDGGGVYNSGTLLVTDSLIGDNLAGAGGDSFSRGGAGGGLCNVGLARLTGIVISGNVAGPGGLPRYMPGTSVENSIGGPGGGIYNVGVLSLTGSTICSNRSGVGGDGIRIFTEQTIWTPVKGGSGGSGGGVQNEGMLSMTNSTVFGNSGGQGGFGGTYWNSVAQGGPGGDGGGIFNLGYSTLVNCTISGNQSGTGGLGGTNLLGDQAASGADGSGGGIYSQTNLFRVLNTLISSNNAQTNVLGHDVVGTFVSLGHNLVGINEAKGFGVIGDVVGTISAPLNAKVAPLSDNGGGTPTCALLSGSPAVDAGWDVVLSAPWTISNDQRGVPRKLGAHCDIGAFEFSASTPQFTLTLITNGPGSIVVSPSAGPYFSNTLVTLVANTQANTVFDSWSGSVTGSAVTNTFWITSNTVVQANFHAVVLLTLSTPGGGTVYSSANTNSIALNSSVTLSATPSNGWSFIRWAGDVASTTPEITVLMDSNKTVQAVFGTPVNTTVAGNGTVLAIPELSLYPYGTSVSLLAKADVGSVFSHWEHDGIWETNPVLSLVVTSAQPSIVARFEAVAGSKVWVVGNTNDSGAGSLRGAISNAASGDVIKFSVTGAVSLTNGEIIIDKNLSVTGPGAAFLSIDANRLSRIFNIPSNSTVSLSGLTLTNGKPGVDSLVNGLPGGAILNAGTLTLDACSIRGNFTSAGGYNVCGNGGNGAGICNQGTLFVNGCLIAGNYCGSGGAVVAFKGLTQGGLGGSGGGIYNSGFLRVRNTTIQGNTAGNGGAGPVGLDADPSLLLGGDGGDGGGVLNTASATIVNTTISGNWHGFGGSAGISFGSNYITGTPGAAGLGGGFHSISNAATILNTLIAGNRSEIDPISADVTGVVNSLGHNLVGMRDSGSSGLGAEGDLLGTVEHPVDPLLATLADNGGPVFTCALLAGSPAIDAGDDAVLASPWNLLADACGMIRIAGAHVDIGSYEYGGTTNIAPQLGISTSRTGQSVQLVLKGNPARAFDIVVSTNLVQWTRLTTVTNVYGTVSYSVPNTLVPLQFYRAKQLP